MDTISEFLYSIPGMTAADQFLTSPIGVASTVATLTLGVVVTRGRRAILGARASR